MSSLYGPFTILGVQGQKIITQGSYPETLAMIVYNESPFFLNVHFGGGVSLPVPAFCADIIPVPQGFNGGITIDGTSYLSSQGQTPSTVAFIIGLGSQDAITKLLLAGLPTGFPCQLNRLQNLGNLSGVASAQAIVNDGNAVTPWLETTPTGSPGSTWSASTDGSMTVKELQAGTLTQLLKLIVGTGVQLGASNRTTEILGDLLADGNAFFTNAKGLYWKDTGGTSRLVEQVNNFNQLQLFGITGTDILQFLKSDGTIKAVLDLVQGALNITTLKTTIAGGTAGSVDIWQPFQGSTFNVLIAKLSGFQTGASNQDYALNVPFANGGFFFTGAIGTINLLHSGGAQSVSIITALAAAGGTSTFQADINGFSFGNIPPTEPFDTLRFKSGNAQTHNGFIVIIGN